MFCKDRSVWIFTVILWGGPYSKIWFLLLKCGLPAEYPRCSVRLLHSGYTGAAVSSGTAQFPSSPFSSQPCSSCSLPGCVGSCSPKSQPRLQSRTWGEAPHRLLEHLLERSSFLVPSPENCKDAAGYYWKVWNSDLCLFKSATWALFFHTVVKKKK